MSNQNNKMSSIILEMMRFLLSVMIVIASSFALFFIADLFFTQRYIGLNGKYEWIKAFVYLASILRGSFGFLMLLVAVLHVYIFRKNYIIIHRKFVRLILRSFHRGKFSRFFLFEIEVLLNIFLLTIASAFFFNVTFTESMSDEYLVGDKSLIFLGSWRYVRYFSPLIAAITYVYIIQGFSVSLRRRKMKDQNLAMNNASGKDVNRIDQLSRTISSVFYGHALLMTLFQFWGCGDILAGLIGEIFLKSMSSPFTVGKYFFMALPVLISVYSVKTNFNERSRKLVQGFSICAFLNYAIIIVPAIPILPLAYFYSEGATKVPAFILFGLIGVGLSVFLMAWVFIASRRLGRLKQSAGYEISFGGSFGYALLMAALFVASGMLMV